MGCSPRNVLEVSSFSRPPRYSYTILVSLPTTYPKPFSYSSDCFTFFMVRPVSPVCGRSCPSGVMSANHFPTPFLPTTLATTSPFR